LWPIRSWFRDLRRSTRHHIGPVRSGLPRGVRAGRFPPEAVEALRELNVFETEGGHQGEELCLRQSTRNSGRPQVGVHSLFFVQVHIEEDVSQV
jgi:hypothetical protein